MARGEARPPAIVGPQSERARDGQRPSPRLPALPALAALGFRAGNDKAPARAGSARSRAAFPDAARENKNDASGAASREDAFEFAGTSPTPATFGVSPLSASPVPGDARWNLGAVGAVGAQTGTSAKGSRTMISPVSVLTVPALDLSVSFEY